MLVKLPLSRRIFAFVLMLFWGSLMVMRLIFSFLKSPRKFLYSKDYSSVPKVAKERASFDYTLINTPAHKNVKIAYAHNGKRGAPLMLFIHGFPECWYSWRHQMDFFKDKYWTVAIDLKGYGGSDKPKGLEPYAISNLVEDIAGVITALGYESAVVVAHDWGGVITWNFASTYPDMCDKVIIMNAPHTYAFAKVIGKSYKQLLASWYMYFFQMPYVPEIMLGCDDFKMIDGVFRGKETGVKNREMMTPDDVAIYKNALYAWESRESALNYYRALLTYKNKPKTVKVEPTLLLIWGTEDKALTKELASASMEFAPNGQLKFIEGASHWVQQDSPDKVNAAMNEFLTQ